MDDLITIKVENGSVSEAGARLNISVALQYLNSWLQVNLLANLNSWQGTISLKL